MKKLSRFLSLVLVLALIAPVLMAVPVRVSASETAMYSYNGVVLPALPSITDGANCFIYEKEGVYRIYWFGSGSTIRAKSTNRLAVSSGPSDIQYGVCLADNGEWTVYTPSTLESARSMEFNNVLNVIWSNVDIPYTSGSGLYLSASEPLQVSFPNVPVLQTSFDDQVVYIAEDETYNLYVDAQGINGTPSIEWYCMREQEDGTFSNGEVLASGDMVSYADGCYVGAWKYTPDADAAPYTIMFKAIVTNTLGDLTASSETGFVVLNVTAYDDSGGSGDSDDPGSSGSDDETLGKLEELKTDISEVQHAVDAVQSELEGANDNLNHMISGESGVDSSVTDFSDVSDSLTNSLGDANAVIGSGVESLSGFVSSDQMLGTAAAFGSILTAAFVGNEISLCGISGNPFELAVIFFGSMGVIVLVVNYVFRKRGGG